MRGSAVGESVTDFQTIGNSAIGRSTRNRLLLARVPTKRGIPVDEEAFDLLPLQDSDIVLVNATGFLAMEPKGLSIEREILQRLIQVWTEGHGAFELPT